MKYYKTKFIIPYIITAIFFTPFLLVLATVFVIDNRLANGVVSGKYFWFYGSMGLVCISTFIYSLTNKQPFRFSPTDGFVFLFTGSVFLSAFLSSDISINSTKLTLLALLPVLYLCLRLVLEPVGGARCSVHDKGDTVTGDRSPVTRDLSPVTGLQTVICFFILLTGLVEAVWGLMQLYGFKLPQHALFKLTGSFFNPGPYAGYLAVVFPLALSFWVASNRQPVTGKRFPVTRHLSLVTKKWLGGITCITPEEVVNIC